MEEQKGINVQLAQRIDTVESTLNKRIYWLESNLNKKNRQPAVFNHKDQQYSGGTGERKVPFPTTAKSETSQ